MRKSSRFFILILCVVFLVACNNVQNNKTEVLDYSTFSDAKRAFITRLTALNEFDENGVLSWRYESLNNNTGEISSTTKIIFDRYKDYGYIEKPVIDYGTDEIRFILEFYTQHEQYTFDSRNNIWYKHAYSPEVDYYNTLLLGNGPAVISSAAIAFFENADDEQFYLGDEGEPYFEARYESDLLFMTPFFNDDARTKDPYSDAVIINGELKKAAKVPLPEEELGNNYAYFDGESFNTLILSSTIIITPLDDETIPELPQHIIETEAKDYHPDWNFVE